MDLSRFPRRRYTQGFTPIEPLHRLSRALGGPDIYLKRDDMLGLFPGGNKTRKLEFLVADALAVGADTLITCGAVQSNHCRITLSAAVKEGLKCRLVLEERVAGSYDPHGNGNHFMFELLGAETIEVLPGGSDMAAAMQRQADALAAVGRKGYVIPGGGSNALGGLGYVACAQEILAQSFESGIRFDVIVVGSGSSGTHGGLLAGLAGMNVDIPVIGIGVSRDAAEQEPLVHAEAQAVLALLRVKAEVARASVRSVGGYWQPKYSLPNRRMVEAVQMLARLEAVPLDPTYTGKAMAGLIGLVRAGEFRRDAKVLFIHTGGLPSLFASTEVVLGRQDVADA
ncbi:MAG: D-cysteine desulfhydrase [Piscinibacter sp.]|nr:D-cysteine desulfhydrase [Piscinibacter sp.]